MATKYVSVSGKVVSADKVRPFGPGSSLLVWTVRVEVPTAKDDDSRFEDRIEIVREVNEDARAEPFDFRRHAIGQHLAHRAMLQRR